MLPLPPLLSILQLPQRLGCLGLESGQSSNPISPRTPPVHRDLCVTGQAAFRLRRGLRSHHGVHTRRSPAPNGQVEHVSWQKPTVTLPIYSQVIVFLLAVNPPKISPAQRGRIEHVERQAPVSWLTRTPGSILILTTNLPKNTLPAIFGRSTDTVASPKNLASMLIGILEGWPGGHGVWEQGLIPYRNTHVLGGNAKWCATLVIVHILTSPDANLVPRLQKRDAEAQTSMSFLRHHT